MYAAAGGASIASRQARQKQKQKKAQALQKAQQSTGTGTPGLKPPLGSQLKPPHPTVSYSGSKINLASSAPTQSKQFHNLPSHYYNQSQQYGVNKPKSSHADPTGRGGFTPAGPGALKPPISVHRRNSSNVHVSHTLRPSETVAGHLSRTKSTPKIHHSQSCIFATKEHSTPVFPLTEHPSSPILTTTCTSKGLLAPEPPERVDSIDAKSSLVPPSQHSLHLVVDIEKEEEILTDETGKPLERRCSVRHRQEIERQEQMRHTIPTMDDNHLSYDNQNQLNHQMGYNENRPRWDIMYDSNDKYSCGSLDFPFSECSQGRAAWQERERERRGSLTEAALSHRTRQTEAHLRWMKRNRIHDASYGGSSDEEDILGGLYGHQSAAANALLYVGLGTVAIGAVIFFVGTGEKGFKTLELRLIGPTLVGCGFLCCLVRILLCVCPSRCFRRRKRKRCRHGGNRSSHRFRNPPPNEDFRMADHNTSLLRKQTNNNKKRVSIATGSSKPIASTSQNTNIATTSLFLQNEQEKNVVPKVIPKIEIPHLIEVSDVSDLNKQTNNIDKQTLPKADSIIELQNLEMYDDVSSASSVEDDNIPETTDATNTEHVNHDKSVKLKMNRKRESVNQQSPSSNTVMETSLTVEPKVNLTKKELTSSSVQPETSGTQTKDTNKKNLINNTINKTTPGEIVLSPSKLGQ